MRTRTPFLLLLGLSALSASAATFVTGGTVSGPTTSTDNAIVRFDGTTGRTIQNSGATLDDNGTISLTGSGSATLGLLSFPSGVTTKNQGIVFPGANNLSIFRNFNGRVQVDYNSDTEIELSENGTKVAHFAASSGSAYFGSTQAGSSTYLRSGAATIFLTGDASQNATFAGQLKAPVGSAANPSYGFTGVSGVGAYYEAGGFRIATNGAVRVVVDGGSIYNFGGLYQQSGGSTSGSTDFLINPTIKTSGNLIDAQVNGTSKFKVDYSGLISIGGSTPASASAAGTAGTVTWDSSYIYICTATNTWKRAAIATW